MARPTKISKEHIDIAYKYLEECGDTWEEYRKSESTNQFGGSESWGQRLYVKLPSVAGLLVEYSKHARKEKLFNFRIVKSTINEWRNKGEELSSKENLTEEEELFVEFSVALEEISDLQEKMLLDGGVSNQYGQVVTKLLLSANHGYKEKTEQEVNHSGSVDLGGFFGNKADEHKKDSLVG